LELDKDLFKVFNSSRIFSISAYISLSSLFYKFNLLKSIFKMANKLSGFAPELPVLAEYTEPEDILKLINDNTSA